MACSSFAEEIENAARTQLGGCRGLAHDVENAVAMLSEAGSALQKVFMAHKTPTVQDSLADDFASAVLSACGGIGAALVSLAATLSVDIIAPLQELREGVEIDCEKLKRHIAKQQEYVNLCSKALAESIQRKEKVAVDLTNAVEEHKRLQVSFQRNGSVWRNPMMQSSSPEQELAASQARFLNVLKLEAAIVEEIAMRTDEVALAKARVAEANVELQSTQRCISYARTTLFEALLGRSASAWDDISKTIQGVACQLRGDASALERVKPPCPKVRGARPVWLCNAEASLEAIKLSRADGAALSDSVTIASDTNSISPIKLDEHSAPRTPWTIDCENQEERRKLSEEWARLYSTQQSWKESQEARDIELLEREETLRQLQDDLDVRARSLHVKRRSLAVEQAISLAALERSSCTSPERRSFVINDGTPQSRRRSVEAGLVDAFDESNHADDIGGDEDEEDAIEAEEDAAQPDAVWEMDWSRLAERSRSRSSSPSSFSAREHNETTFAGSTDDNAQVAPASERGPDISKAGQILETKELATRPLARQQQQLLGTKDEDADPFKDEMLRSKLEEKRRLAELHNGEDFTVAPRGLAPKDRMAGIHPAMAAKLEMQRRKIEEAEAAQDAKKPESAVQIAS